MRSETKAWLERQRLLGEAAEIPDDVVPFGESRAQYLEDLNVRRVARGLEPFENDEVGNPDLTERRRQRYEQFRREEAQKPRTVFVGR